jgi:hypothetical protein
VGIPIDTWIVAPVSRMVMLYFRSSYTGYTLSPFDKMARSLKYLNGLTLRGVQCIGGQGRITIDPTTYFDMMSASGGHHEIRSGKTAKFRPGSLLVMRSINEITRSHEADITILMSTPCCLGTGHEDVMKFLRSFTMPEKVSYKLRILT